MRKLSSEFGQKISQPPEARKPYGHGTGTPVDDNFNQRRMISFQTRIRFGILLASADKACLQSIGVPRQSYQAKPLTQAGRSQAEELSQ